MSNLYPFFKDGAMVAVIAANSSEEAEKFYNQGDGGESVTISYVLINADGEPYIFETANAARDKHRNEGGRIFVACSVPTAATAAEIMKNVVAYIKKNPTWPIDKPIDLR